MTPDELRAWRLRLGLSQNGLAVRLGINPITISRWERGAPGHKIPPLLPLAMETVERRIAQEREGK